MDTSALRAEIEKRIAASGAEVGFAFRTLDGREELLIRPDQAFHAASTMKVPVLIELFAQVHAGKLRLDERLAVKNDFPSLVDGSLYHLDANDDSDAEVYKSIGGTMPVEELAEHMITHSSNLATDVLIERIGVANIQKRMQKLHAEGMQVLRGVEDEKAFEAGRNNTTTARALLTLLLAIAEAKGVDPESSRAMLGILERQTFNEAIPAGLPAGTRVAHKTGEITGIHHDAAIVYAPRPFVLVLLVRGIEDRDKSSALMAEITRLVYAASQKN